MLKNHLVTAWRNLWRNRFFSLLNIFGLALGIGGTVLIFLLIKFEISFDTHHPNQDKIYRVVVDDNAHGDHRFTQAVPYPLFDALREDFNEIENLTIVDANFQSPIITVDRNSNSVRYKEERGIAFVDPDYFEIFPYQWLEGNPKSALADQKTVVLSESLAKRYFGGQDPLGQIINFDSQFDLKVTGLVEDAPKNSDLPFNMLISFNLGEENKRGWDSWDASSGRVNAYLKLKSTADEAYINSRLKSYLTKYWDDAFAAKTYLSLQPLGDLHFDSRFANFNSRVVSRKTIWAMGLIGLFLLVTSCINFINLNTVMAARRSKEVGVRKVLGSPRLQLVYQFMSETLIVTCIAVLVALVLVQLTFFKIEHLVGYDLSIGFFNGTTLLTFLLLIVVSVCLLAGLYPALLISGYQPILAIKNKINTPTGSSLSFRKSLITVQLVISQVLVICTLVVASQMDYFINKHLGFDKEAILEFPMPVRNKENVRSMANLLEGNAQIKSVSFSSTGASSDNSWGGDFTFENGQEVINQYTHVKFMDENFLTTYGIGLGAGENLVQADSANMFLVNEAFVKAMGLADPELAVGQYVQIWGKEAPIAGVIKDFNTTSLHELIKPCVFMVGAESYHMGAVKITGNDISSTIASIDNAWSSTFPDHIFEYSFLDETITAFYDGEQRISLLFKVFAALAIIIGSIGLFGLISFIANRKIKEIGVRKVLGASVGNIVVLFSKEFVLLTIIAFAIAAPIGYYTMRSWLANFNYHIDLGVGIFILAVLISLLIVLVTIGYQSIKSAISNPIESLRYE